MWFRSVIFQGIHTDGGPGFEPVVEWACELIEGVEAHVGQFLFEGGDDIAVELEAVDDAEVDGADFVRIIIDDGVKLLGGVAGEGDFLADFSFHSCEVGGDVICKPVDGVDVTADAQGHFVVQSGFTAFFSAGVGEDFSLVAEDGVGDDLLVAGALFSDIAVQVVSHPGLQESVEIILRVEAHSIEGAYGFECLSGHDQYLFSIVA